MILTPTIKANMSSFIENNDIQREAVFVYEPIAREAVPTPLIKVPFPPPINPEDLVKKDGVVPSRSPNAFLIYRRVYLKELQAQNYAYKMTDVSSMVSASWRLESEDVKKEYLRIAREANNMLTTTRQKSLSFSRRKWRSQNHSNNNTRTPKTKKSSNPQAPRKKPTATKTTPQAQITQSETHLIKNQHIIEDRQLFSPSFAFSMADVDSYLFATYSRDFIWTQSPVSDVLAYSDGESSTSTDVGIDDVFVQLNLTSTLPTVASYKRSMHAYHAFNLHLLMINLY